MIVFIIAAEEINEIVSRRQKMLQKRVPKVRRSFDILGTMFAYFLDLDPIWAPMPKNVRFLTPKYQKYSNLNTKFGQNTEEKTPTPYPNTHRNITRGTGQYLPSSMKKNCDEAP